MLNRFTTYTLLIVLSLLPVLGISLMNQLQNEATPANVTLQPDAIIRNAKATVYNAIGRPKIEIVTPNLTHYNTNNTSRIETPQIKIFRGSPNPWQVSAHEAIATHGIDDIQFRQHVLIRHPVDALTPETTVVTNHLTVYPNEKKATTTEPIQLLQPNLNISATGMKLNLETGDITLLSESRGVYVPAS